MRVLAGYGEIPKERKRVLCHQISVSDFFKISPVYHALPPAVFDTADGDTGYLPTVQQEVPSP
jgi:hypothetical protein